MDISARFADQSEALKLKEKGYQSIPSGEGSLILPPSGVRMSETVKLGISKFLWNTRITIKGLRYDG